MSEFKVTVVKVGNIIKHPNADALDVTKVFDYTVITKRGEFKEGDLAVYIPVDSIVPDIERWHFLAPAPKINDDGTVLKTKPPVGQVPEKYRIIEAKKLRGVFSQGMLTSLPPGVWTEGDDVCEALNITKYEPTVANMPMSGECESPPVGWVFSQYTDVEGMRRHPNIIQQGEQVVLSEKIHGSNYRVIHDGTRLWVGSHHQIKKDGNNVWWNLARQEKLEDKLKSCPGHIFFGEIYGNVQDLKYGITNGCKLKIFDVFDTKTQRYLDYVDARKTAEDVSLEWVPILFEGTWDDSLKSLSEGSSTIPGAKNIREGFVVRPMKERWDPTIGRVCLKYHGESYLLRKKTR